jgi:predicted hexulose-6-phosphate isomerase
MYPYLLGLYEKALPDSSSLAEKLFEARRAGFDYLELSIDESDARLARLDWDVETRAALRRAQARAGTPIRSICLSGHRRFPLGDPDPETRQTSLAILEKAVVLAARLGVRLIQLAGYDVYYKTGGPETRAFFAENLRRSVLLAAREGVVLAFETMETAFMDTVEKAMYWVREIDSPWLQVYPDIGNITNAALLYGGGVSRDLGTGRGHLAALHLKETKPDIFREVPFGQGHVDFPGAARTALALGVRMFVGEFWHDGRTAWRELLRENNRFLREALGKAPGETGCDR